jgi:hypothetical protein
MLFRRVRGESEYHFSFNVHLKLHLILNITLYFSQLDIVCKEYVCVCVCAFQYKAASAFLERGRVKEKMRIK